MITEGVIKEYVTKNRVKSKWSMVSLDWILENRKDISGKLVESVSKWLDTITWLLIVHKFKDGQVFEHLTFQKP